MSRVRRWTMRAARMGAGQAWAGVRPGGVTDLTARGATAAPRDGTTPRPDQVFLPTTRATGPWADVDPLLAGRWYSRHSVLAAVAMWAYIGFRVRRALRETSGGFESTEAGR